MVKIYEDYHINRNIQKRIINKNDYTYRGVLGYLNQIDIKGKKILDIGCGVGTIDFYLAKKGGRVLGIDISNNGIKIARKNARNLNVTKDIQFRNVDFPRQTPKGKFDIVLCLEILEHIKDDYLAVNKISKMLKKDGILIASSPSVNSVLFKFGFLRRFDSEVGHLRRYSVKSFTRLFLKSKLNVVYLKRTQGVLRDLLFTTKIGGQLLRFINKWPLAPIFSLIDDVLTIIFGESDLFVLVKK